MSVDLAATARALLDIGDPGRRPAGACVGAATPAAGPVLAAAGWALLPDPTQHGEPMTTTALHDLASVTKIASTTALAMRLAAAGLLDVDAPAARHLAGFGGGDKNRITVADLLAHRGGLTPWWPLYCTTTDREAALDLAEQLPLAAAPGTRRIYSDIGFQLLGRVLEGVTGTGLAEAFRQWVAEPLGLRRTGYGPVDPATTAASADGDGVEARMVESDRPYPVPFTPADFTGWRTATVRGTAADGNTAHALGGVSGHAGLFAPLDELLTLGAALARDEEFVPAAVRARFTTPADPADPGAALGFRRYDLPTPGGPIPMIGHDGFTGTHLAAATDRDLTLAVSATRLHGTDGARADLVPTELLARTAGSGVVRALTAAGALPGRGAPAPAVGSATTSGSAPSHAASTAAVSDHPRAGAHAQESP